MAEVRNGNRRPISRESVRTPRGARAAVRRGIIAERFEEGLGLLLAVAAVYLALVLVTYSPTDPSLSHAGPGGMVMNAGGWFGAYMADLLLSTFGVGAFVWALWLCFHAWSLLSHQERPGLGLQVVTLALMFPSLGVLLYVAQPLPDWPQGMQGIGNGGLFGKLVASMMLPFLGKAGAIMLMTAVLALSVLWFTGWTLGEVKATCIWTYRVTRVMLVQMARWVNRLQSAVPEQFDLPLSDPIPVRPKVSVIRAEGAITKSPREHGEPRQAALPLEGEEEGFMLPPLDLLSPPKPRKGSEDEAALEQNARRIEAELANFNIEGKVTHVRPGPVITIYELEPAAGVKTSSILNVQDDLARAMSALSIRIAPIPGRNVLGIELPNRERQYLGLRELLDTDAFEHDAGKLVVSLGVDTTGQPVYADLSKMPHSLIAGTTGSGKSVAINAFILSLLYRMTPDEVRFVMVDPKMLELSIYNDIPHLLTPVITDPNKAAAALNWVVKEMENRYRLMSELGVKNLAGFNEKFEALQAEGKVPTKLVQTGFDLTTGQPHFEEQPLATKPMPYIVVVIDELADLMMVAGKAVEFSIARLTQMARAAGIHLLVATQRPSVDVVTGLIKANIPTRISFSVASKIDSRTVLDSMGAETLLGKGDMLYLANGSNALQRLHGSFVGEEECIRVADFVKAQKKVDYVEDVFRVGPAVVPGSKEARAAESAASDEEGGEDLYQQAMEIVTRENKASTSFLQRHLKIGYNRAADLIDRMESEGVISAPNHVGKREILGAR